jgi:hypothetical protein
MASEEHQAASATTMRHTRSQTVDGQADLEVARFIFDVQLRQLERSSFTAQGLIAAVTITAAIASPLLVAGVHRSAGAIVYGVLIVVYLGSLAVAVRASLSVLFTRSGHIPKGHGILHYGHISSYPTPAAFADRFEQLGDRQELTREILDEVWSLAQVVQIKATKIGSAAVAGAVSLILLGMLVVARFILNIIQ